MRTRQDDDESHSSTGSLTRRKFLQGTATGLSLTWGGAHVFAAPSGRSREGTATQTPAKNFVYGTHFYHPQSGPRPDEFRTMIDAIANKYRFNIIRIYPPWDEVLPILRTENRPS
jgi:hypothetical protein